MANPMSGTEDPPKGFGLAIERIFMPSAIRRGRLATSPTFFVNAGGYRWRFSRRVDARHFVNAGGTCPTHYEYVGRCRDCLGSRAAQPSGQESDGK